MVDNGNPFDKVYTYPYLVVELKYLCFVHFFVYFDKVEGVKNDTYKDFEYVVGAFHLIVQEYLLKVS
jgi:hypothetical protein